LKPIETDRSDDPNSHGVGSFFRLYSEKPSARRAEKLLPLTKWKAERETLNEDLQRLNSQHFALKNEVGTVEKIRRNITDIMQEQMRTRQRAKENDMEL